MKSVPVARLLMMCVAAAVRCCCCRWTARRYVCLGFQFVVCCRKVDSGLALLFRNETVGELLRIISHTEWPTWFVCVYRYFHFFAENILWNIEYERALSVRRLK